MDNLSTNLTLVRSIREYPCLYDNNLPANTQKEITEKAWSEVANKTGISAAECKEKWKNLRWGFIRSLRPNFDGSLKKKYYLHDDMEFVLPFLRLLPKHGNNVVQPPADSDTDEEKKEILEHEFLEYETLQGPSAKRSRTHEPAPNHTTDSNEILDNPPSPQFFEYGILQEPPGKRNKVKQTSEKTNWRKMFLLSLLPEVNILTETQMRAFRRKVLRLIDDIVEDEPRYCDGREEQTHDTIPKIKTDIIKTEIAE